MTTGLYHVFVAGKLHVFSLEKCPNLDPTLQFQILQLGCGIQKQPSVLSMVSSYKPMHSKQTQMASKRNSEPQKAHSSSLQCCTVFPLKPIYRLFSFQSQCCWIEQIQNAFCILLPPISGTCFGFATAWSVKKSGKSRLQDVIPFLTFHTFCVRDLCHQNPLDSLDVFGACPRWAILSDHGAVNISRLLVMSCFFHLTLGSEKAMVLKVESCLMTCAELPQGYCVVAFCSCSLFV